MAKMKTRPIFKHDDQAERWRALTILRDCGYHVREDDNLVLLVGVDATNVGATLAGNMLQGFGYSGGICW